LPGSAVALPLPQPVSCPLIGRVWHPFSSNDLHDSFGCFVARICHCCKGHIGYPPNTGAWSTMSSALLHDTNGRNCAVNVGLVQSGHWAEMGLSTLPLTHPRLLCLISAAHWLPPPLPSPSTRVKSSSVQPVRVVQPDAVCEVGGSTSGLSHGDLGIFLGGGQTEEFAH